MNEGREQIIYLDSFVSDSLAHDLIKAYVTENVVSSFVKCSWLCPIVRNSLNLFNPSIVEHVRGTAAIHLTLPEYRKIYSIVRELEASFEGMSHNSLILELYEYAGITHVGSCFFRDLVSKTATKNQFYESCWQKIEAAPDLVIIKDSKTRIIIRVFVQILLKCFI